MFKSTKAHQKEISSGQPRLRLGNRVPEDAVNLAYSFVTPPNPAENIQLADTSIFILENAASDSTSDVDYYPNSLHLLADVNGVAEINSQTFLITNVFKDGVPLYYGQVLKYYIIDENGPDEFGFYTGKGISLINKDGRPVGPDKKYKVMLKSVADAPVPNAWQPIVFTSFKTQTSDNIRVAYNGVDFVHNVTIPKTGYLESLNTNPVFTNQPLDVVMSNPNGAYYYKAETQRLGQAFLYSTRGPIDDGRTPIQIKWQAKAVVSSGITQTTYTTPWSEYVPVYSENSLTTEEKDSYLHGALVLSDVSAKDLLAFQTGPIPAGAIVTYSIAMYPNRSDIRLGCRPDGVGKITATALVDTGTITLPDRYIKKADGKFYPVYSINLSQKRQIKVVKPIEENLNESWYARIRVGRFERIVGNYQYIYIMPEYFRQNFNPTLGQPYRDVANEKPAIIGERRLKVRRTPIYRVDSVKLNEGTPQEVPLTVESFNAQDGTIELVETVQPNDKLTVDYVYEEAYYNYRGFYDSKNLVFWSLDLNPTHGHISTIIDKDGTIKDYPSYALMNKTIYFYIRPNARYNKVDGNYVLDNTFTVNNSPVFHSFTEVTDEPNTLLLAKLWVRPNSSIESVKLTSTKVRGGGLKEGIGQAIIKEFGPETNFYWDIGYWDGEPYPENSVIVVKLPKGILEEYGGRFSRTAVEEAVQKHMAYGMFYIIEYIDEPNKLVGKPENVTVTIVDI